MASARPWPFDDDDRPSGSVQPLSQADLQAILAHLGDDPDKLLADTIGDRPVVAIRVRASVGRPGGSAHAQWRWGSDTPPASWLGWSGTGGRSCTTWPFPAAEPTSTTWWSALVGCS